MNVEGLEPDHDVQYEPVLYNTVTLISSACGPDLCIVLQHAAN